MLCKVLITLKKSLQVFSSFSLFKCNVKPWELGMGCGKMVELRIVWSPLESPAQDKLKASNQASILKTWDMGGKTCEL
jgi:hypothetical protein